MNNFYSSITFLRTTDLEQTSVFYEQVLHCPVILDQDSCKIFETSKGSYLGFCTNTKPVKEAEAVCLTFVVPTREDVNVWFRVLNDHNVPLEHAPVHNRTFKIYHFFATDPNGYTLEIQAFIHPFPPE